MRRLDIITVKDELDILAKDIRDKVKLEDLLLKLLANMEGEEESDEEGI